MDTRDGTVEPHGVLDTTLPLCDATVWRSSKARGNSARDEALEEFEADVPQMGRE
jgi:hypothetical protein